MILNIFFNKINYTLMNKIYFIITLFISGFSLAQVSIFENLEDFHIAYTGELILEDFAGAPEEPTLCGTVVSAGVENGCFALGELIEGFSLTASNDSEVVLLPAGFLPSENQTPRLGANSGAEKSIISFEPNVYAVGLALHIDNNDDFFFRAYGENNVLLYESEINFSPFIGIVSDEPITRIEVENATGAGELMGDLQFGTVANMSVTDHQTAKISYYPNPVQNILHLNSKENISEVEVYDLIGRKIFAVNSFNDNDCKIDFSKFPQGTYLVKVKLKNDFKSFQIIKK